MERRDRKVTPRVQLYSLLLIRQEERRLDGAEAEERMFCWEAVPPSMTSGVDLT